MQNNIGPNIDDGLNFATCEQTFSWTRQIDKRFYIN